METDADIIALAVDYIDQHGWCQREHFGAKNSDGTYPACAWGGVFAVVVGPGKLDSQDKESRQKINRVLNLLDTACKDVGHFSMPGYNDGNSRTWEEVKSVMLDTVSDLRLKEQ